MTVEELQGLKIGLVLGGGGGKGAYEIGCWNALRNKKIPISMVSGSSVGALNAVLIATDSFDEGNQL
jgi:NTE family protein